MIILRRYARFGRSAIGIGVNAARALRPAAVRARREVAVQRNTALAWFDRLSRDARAHLPPEGIKRVLVDGMWDNANYWLRYAMVRSALGLHHTEEIGMLGQFARGRVKEAFAGLGINRLVDFYAASRHNGPYRRHARQILAQTRVPDDVLNWSLPGGVPPDTFFDAILKTQRTATIDLADPLLEDLVASGLASIHAAEKILDEVQPDCVFLSHALNFHWVALACAAMRRGIATIVLYGDFGSARFLRLKEPRDILVFPSRPSDDEVAALSDATRQALTQAGRSYLEMRLGGQTGDISAVSAYRKQSDSISRKQLCDAFGWDPAKPIVGVYASNWYDYPRSSGLNTFRDFLDWIEVTLRAAKANSAVNWLLREHPCDLFKYGGTRGVTLSKLVEEAQGDHIRLSGRSWNGAPLMRALDGVVTCHGTVGVEASFVGTPVLTASWGWYSAGGFTVQAKGRDHYASLLASPWWEGWDVARSRDLACLYAGWYFAVPDWQDGLVLRDDSEQDRIFAEVVPFLERNYAAVLDEIDNIRGWYLADHPFYHIYKIAQAGAYKPCVPAG